MEKQTKFNTLFIALHDDARAVSDSLPGGRQNRGGLCLLLCVGRCICGEIGREPDVRVDGGDSIPAVKEVEFFLL